MGRLLANSESFDFRSAGERADKSEDLQMHSFLMLHNLVEGSGPLRRLRGEGHQASRITSVKWVRRPAAAAGPPSNTLRNYIKKPGPKVASDGGRHQFLDRPPLLFRLFRFFRPAGERAGKLLGHFENARALRVRAELNLGRWDLAGSFFVLVKSGPAKLGLAGPVRKF